METFELIGSGPKVSPTPSRTSTSPCPTTSSPQPSAGRRIHPPPPSPAHLRIPAAHFAFTTSASVEPILLRVAYPHRLPPGTAEARHPFPSHLNLSPREPLWMSYAYPSKARSRLGRTDPRPGGGRRSRRPRGHRAQKVRRPWNVNRNPVMPVVFEPRIQPESEQKPGRTASERTATRSALRSQRRWVMGCAFTAGLRLAGRLRSTSSRGVRFVRARTPEDMTPGRPERGLAVTRPEVDEPNHRVPIEQCGANYQECRS